MTATHLVCGIQMHPYNVRLLLPKVYPLDIGLLRDDLILTFCLFVESQASNFFTPVNELSPGHDMKNLKFRCRTSTRLRFFPVRVIQP